MIVVTHFISFLVNEYFTPACLREVKDITREVVQCLKEKDRKSISGFPPLCTYCVPLINTLVSAVMHVYPCM